VFKNLCTQVAVVYGLLMKHVVDSGLSLVRNATNVILVKCKFV
jgi:hypothetical protein